MIDTPESFTKVMVTRQDWRHFTPSVLTVGVSYTSRYTRPLILWGSIEVIIDKKKRPKEVGISGWFRTLLCVPERTQENGKVQDHTT